MLEIKDIEIDGFKFQLNPLKGFKALRLDKFVISLMLPLIEGVENLDSEIDLGKALAGLSGALDDLPDAKYEKFILDLLSTTIVIPEKGNPVELTQSVIDDHFQGASLVLYKLMFEVMKYNNFTPFVLVGGGGKGTIKTLFSSQPTE